MDDVTANPNDSSSLSMGTPSCVANCPLKSKYKEVAAALGERDFKIALLYHTLMRVTGPEKIEGEEAEHLRELLTVFNKATFSGTTMKLTKAQVLAFLEEQRKEQEKTDPAPGGKESSVPEPNNSTDRGDTPGGNSSSTSTSSSNTAEPSGNAQQQETSPDGTGNGTRDTQTTKRGRPAGSKGSFMDHIPEEDRKDGGVVGLPDKERVCPHCGAAMEPIGYKEQKSVSVVPARLVQTTTRYTTYCCSHCKKEGHTVIKQTPMPARFLFHSAIEPEAVAHFAAEKLLLGVPMNTQAQDYQSRGIPISRQDICNYLTRAADQYVIPVANGIARRVMCCNDELSTDETFDMNVKGGRDKDGKPCKQRTCVWIFKGEKGKAAYPGTVFQYGVPRTKERLEDAIYDFSHTPVQTVSIHNLDALDDQQRQALQNVLRICEPNLNNRMKSKKGDGDKEVEETFEFDRTFDDSVNSEAERDEWFRAALAKLAEKKLLTSDGYGGYHFLFNILDSGCMCHDRAKIFRAFVGTRKPAHRKILFELLCLAQDLFVLEQGYKGLTWEERFRVRLKKSYPVMEKMTSICQREYLSAKAAGGLYWEAIRYTVNQMPYLYAFLLDGRLELSNMISERTVKRYARVRRNSLFHMTNVGGHSDSGFLTIFETGRDWDLIPEKYMTFVLREAARIRPEALDELKKGDWVEPLLPHNAPDWCKVNYQPADTDE